MESFYLFYHSLFEAFVQTLLDSLFEFFWRTPNAKHQNIEWRSIFS